MENFKNSLMLTKKKRKEKKMEKGAKYFLIIGNV